jgi:transmembrane sensor
VADRLHDLREHIDASYQADDAALAQLQKRIVRRKVVRSAATALAVIGLALAAWKSAPTAELRTEDGSIATPLEPQTELALATQGPDAVELELKRGRGHFEVTRNPKRRYRVRSGDVTVEVLGTAFDVKRLADATEVHVDHGVVRVSWPAGEALLHAGEGGVFPPKPVPKRSEPPPIEPPTVREKPKKAAHRSERREDWRALAKAGKHGEAFGSLGAQSVEDLEGLLLAADAARLSGHPREAAGYLEHLVSKYPESAPARLAAFTLARLQLNELADPQHAARSFARAYALDPKGPLAEDALAREAEAYRRAGNRERAAEVAARYLAHFPDGARRSEMSSYLTP